MALLNFDSTNVAPQQAMDPVPAGWYNMMMTASEMKPTANADGSYLACEFAILDGQFAKRKIFTNGCIKTIRITYLHFIINGNDVVDFVHYNIL